MPAHMTDEVKRIINGNAAHLSTAGLCADHTVCVAFLWTVNPGNRDLASGNFRLSDHRSGELWLRLLVLAIIYLSCIRHGKFWLPCSRVWCGAGMAHIGRARLHYLDCSFGVGGNRHHPGRAKTKTTILILAYQIDSGAKAPPC